MLECSYIKAFDVPSVLSQCRETLCVVGQCSRTLGKLWEDGPNSAHNVRGHSLETSVVSHDTGECTWTPICLVYI